MTLRNIKLELAFALFRECHVIYFHNRMDDYIVGLRNFVEHWQTTLLKHGNKLMENIVIASPYVVKVTGRTSIKDNPKPGRSFNQETIFASRKYVL
ncbi:hypothetical protein AVEN_31740-1 [Araneus ventricosus]|uniref:Uncharacterized protein n=1 Tax=Araneus ventricosus TaxID=182803 RepID=A0A4Y2JZJ8_ARAVE|nr:hypothetical protein AVEN_31740-1 [Araneus ventricosus]